MFYIEHTKDLHPNDKSTWTPWGLKDGYESRWDAGTDLVDFTPRPVGTFRIYEDRR